MTVSMDTVEITWDNGFIPLVDVGTMKNSKLDSNGFYAILIAKKLENGKWSNYTLLYIGQAFDQTLRQRIQQPHDAGQCINSWINSNPTFALVVMIGLITRFQSNHFDSSVGK